MGLRLDRDARWWHQGREVRHARLAQALHQGLDRHPGSGEFIVRLGHQWCYVEVEDAPFVVRAAIPAGERILLRLSDGATEALDPGTLWLGTGGVLYARVRGGAFPARFSRAAYHALLPVLEEHGAGVALHVGGRFFPIGPA